MSIYDLVVIGGGPAGCAAAYMAGKLGFKTLLVEKSAHLGGAMTSGLVVPAMKSSDRKLNVRFYEDLISEMKSLGGQVTYQNNPGWFNPELLKIALDNMMAKTNVDVILNAYVAVINASDRTIKSIVIKSSVLLSSNYSIDGDKIDKDKDKLSVSIGTRYVVDATGNSEIFKKLGCKFLDTEEETQPFSLRFIMSGIDLKRFSEWLLEIDKNKEVTTVEEIDGVLHLSTACTWDKSQKWALYPIFRAGVANGLLKTADTNYFQVFTIPGMPSSLAFNCPRLVECNSTLTLDNITNALQEGRSTILRLSKFFKLYFPGFKNAFISNIADELGVRSSHRISGKYIYTMDDIISGKKFDRPVAASDYPIDVHSSDKDGSVLKKVNEYEIPIESLMSNEYDNLFAAGRNISADFMAQGAIRIQPTCFSMGEGIARYLASVIRVD